MFYLEVLILHFEPNFNNSAPMKIFEQKNVVAAIGI